LFEDPTWLLVIDIDCGMGASLLGLATSPLQDDPNDRHHADNEILLDWGGCNFIGKDPSRLAVGCIQSMQSRQGGGRLTFVVELAMDCLARIGDLYQGRVTLVMLQFSTPYHF
jgi:hypothetical protein